MSFPRYPKYKPSGVEWLGDVPEHWDLVPFPHLVEFQEGPGIMASDFRDEGVPLLRVSGAQGRWATLDGCNYLDPVAVETRWNHFRLKHGDLVISASASLGTVCEVEDATAGAIPYTGLIRLVPKPGATTKAFIRSMLASNLFSVQIERLKAGTTIQHYGPTHLRQVNSLRPPLSEQSAIAGFLDRETSKIDGLVGEQRRLIELLKEKRQAVISHAVTKGLNPQAPLKPSGIQWLGDVPEHWIVGPVKRFFTSLDGRRIPLSTEERSGRSGEFAYYGASGIIDWIDEYIFDEGLVLVSEDGANLLNRSTSIAFVATGKYWVNNHAHILKPHDDNLWFWAERIEAIDLVPFVTGSAQPKLTAEAMNNLMIAVPPTAEERAAIQRHFMAETETLDALTAEAERAIELLQERRTALISAAVAGKIDVREFSS